MKTLRALYTMRDVARELDTDPRTAQVEIIKNGIPTAKAGKAIVIDEVGLNRLRLIYADKRTIARSA